ncbi:Beta-lactamase domain-containing protein 2 [Holothuria leucospilota]|uniref:Beta-lactamase domain-containing protein 2 n=1 Tax=Holothuria leucospilota TaxID=206669 RepID=A0A9Q1HJL4_HOLLE|nr:Beta-lactamase domain-containing protein 2 [Holothuria leucospilota]
MSLARQGLFVAGAIVIAVIIPADMSLVRKALLVAVAAIVFGVIIPSFFKPSYPVPEIFGTVAPGFEEVREVFRKNYEDNWDHRAAGSALSVYHKGEKVVDLWAGYADVEAKRLWKEDTMTIIFSTTKGLTSLCAAMLVDRGHIELKKPVAHYWPEFAQHGKEKITVEQLLEHEAGLAATNTPLSYEVLKDHDAMDRILAETKPMWEPGTNYGYHGITFGLYVDALIRRTDPKKRTVGQFFDEEVSKPFGIDAYIGVPLGLAHRVGRCINVPGTFSHTIYAMLNIRMVRRMILSSIFGGSGSEMFTKMFKSAGDLCQFGRLADPDILNIEVASFNGVATAEALAKLFDILANGGKQGDKTLLSKRIIDEYINDRRGLIPNIVMFDHLGRRKYGMDVVPQGENAGNVFGASGAGGQVGYADPNNNIGYGFVSRYMSPMGIQFLDPRFKNLQESILKAVEATKKP